MLHRKHVKEGKRGNVWNSKKNCHLQCSHEVRTLQRQIVFPLGRKLQHSHSCCEEGVHLLAVVKTLESNDRNTDLLENRVRLMPHLIQDRREAVVDLGDLLEVEDLQERRVVEARAEAEAEEHLEGGSIG